MTAATLLHNLCHRVAHPCADGPPRLAKILIAIGLACAPIVALNAQAFAQSDVSAHPYAQHVGHASLRFGIPEHWIWAVMKQESGGNARATSPVGAQGLMQVMPATWAMLTSRHDLGSNPYDVRANIMAGAAYLRMMWDRYRDIRLMLAAYNAGPGRVDAYAAGQRGLPSETIHYVARIAPSLGTAAIASLGPVPAPDTQSWRSASVFVAHPESNSKASDAPSAAPPSRAKPATISTPTLPPEGRSHPLFFDMTTNRK